MHFSWAWEHDFAENELLLLAGQCNEQTYFSVEVLKEAKKVGCRVSSVATTLEDRSMDFLYPLW